MNALKNHVQLLGFVDKILSLNPSKQHKKIVRFTLVTIESYNVRSERISERQSHLIVGQGSCAEIFEKNCKPGSKILITGKLSYRKMETGYITEIILSEIFVINKSTDSPSTES